MKVSFKQITLSSLLGLSLLSSIQGEDRGRELFMLNCATCHGSTGKGDTVVGQSLKARDLTSEPFKQGNTLGAITDTILKGVPGTGMVGFTYLNKNDRMALAKFILSIHKPAGGSDAIASSAPVVEKKVSAPVAKKAAPAPVKIAAPAPVVKTEVSAPAPVVKAEVKAPTPVAVVKTEVKKAAPVVAKTPTKEVPKKASPKAESGDSELISKGRSLYKSNGCNSCHGDDGLAGTPTGMALKARNLIKDVYKQGATVEGILGTLKKGVPGTAMAPFPQIAEADSKAIAEFIMAVREGRATAIDTSAATTSNLSSNKVSISYAMSLIAEDPRKPLKKSFASNTNGAKIYAENCASCHGDNGQGNINAKMISPAPFYRVKTQALLGHSGYWLTDKASFVKLVTEGLAGRLMPGNGTLTKAELDDLHSYLKDCFIKAQ